MPTTHTAQAGDSLCSIAYQNGFGDCQPLRAEPANAFILNRAQDPAQLLPGDVVTIPDKQSKVEQGSTDQRHNFVRRGRLASIRFVHGTQNLSVDNDPTITELNVSNYITNQARNPDGDAAFPGVGVTGFNAAANQDVDTFKVEVLDIKASGDLQVDLEALRPTYNAAGAVTGHTQFPAAIRASRELKGVTAKKQGSTQRFRTCYLRLVVDDVDKNAVPTQTLLTSDMHAAGDSQVEILDQLVKASYTIPTCPANPKCKAQVTAPIGTDRRRMRFAVHIFRRSPIRGGVAAPIPPANLNNPVVTIPDAEKRVKTWFRRVFAQAAISPKMMQPIRVVDPVENLVSISNDNGLTAIGGGQFGFRIDAAGRPSQVIGPINIPAGNTPRQTADALAALVQPPYRAAVSDNAPRRPDGVDVFSVDILITEETGAAITIPETQLVRTEARQTLNVGRVNVMSLESWNGDNFLVGSLQQRTALKNYDTGHDRIDLFVVNQVSAGNRAEAMMSGHRVSPARAAKDPIKFSAFLVLITMDSTDNNPFVLSHEVGHVVGEVIHAANNTPQLMEGAGTDVVNTVGANGKRIRDGLVAYDAPAGSFNLVSRMRAEGAALLENW